MGEAIDPKHRYGCHLSHYWEVWSQSNTTEDFFSWLDHGEGQDVDIPRHSRNMLEQCQVLYCSPSERQRYATCFNSTGELVYKLSGNRVGDGAEGETLMFVLAPDLTIYVGAKIKGAFHHSSFLGGGAVAGAGYITVASGKLLRISPHSGHYRPSETSFTRMLALFQDALGISLHGVALDPIEPRKEDKRKFGTPEVSVVHADAPIPSKNGFVNAHAVGGA